MKDSALTPDKDEKRRAPAIAVIGIGCMFPRAGNLDEYWANIQGGVDAITEVPETHWRVQDFFDADPKRPDHTFGTRGGFLTPVEFNPLEFGLSPNALEATDSTQLLGLIAARNALLDAGYGPDRDFDRSRVSTILGVTGTLELVIPLGARLGHPIWRQALQDAGVDAATSEDVVKRIADSYVPWTEDSFPGLLGNVAAGRIANRLDLGGTNCVVDAACASSLSAIHMAALELASGQSDMVITGGLDTFNDIFMYMCFTKTPALTPTGDARPFDRSADGTILGEGLGVLVLKRLEDAERDNDRIYAVIRSIGTSSDGRAGAIYEPSASGQARALRDAYHKAGVSPDSIELVEAHGTGTRVGDAAEASALIEVFRSARETGTWCALGSVKSQIGHTKAAAGAAGMIKAVLALHHKVLPPTLKVSDPPDNLRSGGSPLYANTEARPWLPSRGHPRRAAVSAFGFGGSNFHMVLEEHDAEKKEAVWDGTVQIAVFSAETPEALRSRLDAWPSPTDWEEVPRLAARSRSLFRSEDPCRLALVLEKDRTDFQRILDSARAMLEKSPDSRSWSTPDGVHFGAGAPPGSLGMVFPGQGSQYVGMLRDLACRFPRMQQALAEADRAFTPGENTGENIRRLSDSIYPHPAFEKAMRTANAAQLRATQVAQPAIGAVSVGALLTLEQFGVRPEAVAGHSFGELTALHASGRLDAGRFHFLSHLRGQLMGRCNPGLGAMLAVRAPVETLEKVLHEESLDLVIANKNTPTQAVLSGRESEILRAAEALTRRDIKNDRLPVSAAFHSPLVADAREPFEAALQEVSFAEARIPVFANTTALEYPQAQSEARRVLGGQLAHPVEFVSEIRNMYDSGVHTFLEVGPGRRISGLIKAILEGRDHEAFALDASAGKRSGILDLAHTLARLAVLGHTVDLTAWEGGPEVPDLEDEPSPDPKSSKKMAKKTKKILTVPICGANYVKPRQKRPVVEKKSPDPLGVPAPIPDTMKDLNDVKDLSDPASPRVTEASTGPASPGILEALRLSRENLLALEKIQARTAELHQKFLEGQEASQKTLQALIEQQNRLLQADRGAVVSSVLAPVETPIFPAPAGTPLPEASPDTAAEPVPASPEVPVPAASPPRISASAAEEALLEVVAEKTGYPVDMLDLSMSLDADLGIDSIKRVEILSALEERLPDASKIASDTLGSLQTLQEVVEFMTRDTSGAGDTKPTPPDAPPPRTEAPAPGASPEEIQAALLEVVAEKTGYRVDMLDLSMSLDGDLGIDSIKRVEIFSALEARLPGFPALESGEMGTLETLRQVVDRIVQHTASAPGREPEAGPAFEEIPPEAERSGQVETGMAGDPGPEEAPPRPSHAGARGRVERSVLEAVPLDEEAGRPRIHLPPGAAIWVTEDGSDLASRLVDSLCSLGYEAQAIPLESPGRDSTLEIPKRLGGLVLLAPETVADDFLRSAFDWVKKVGPALRACGTDHPALLVTVSRLDGAFNLVKPDPDSDPVSGGLAGLAKTARLEWPEVKTRALDLARNFKDVSLAADALAREMFHEEPVEVGLALDGLRHLVTTPRSLEAPEAPEEESPLVQKGDVVVVTGGARGVTAESAVALARAGAPSLVLLGRSAAPESEPEWLAALRDEADMKREIRTHHAGDLSPRDLERIYRQHAANREVLRNLQRMTEAGARVEYRQVDVRDARAVQVALAEVRRNLGPIRGLIHGAGVLADRRIQDKTLEHFDRVYETKVKGLRNCLQALGREDLEALKFLVLYSSSTARFGRTGQADYAMANEVLNKTAAGLARRLPRCRVVSLNWGPWDGGMVTPSLRTVFQNEGIELIPAEAGAECLVREIQTGVESVGRDTEVVLLGRDRAASILPSSCCLSSLPTAFERRLDLETYPVLRAHVLDGHVVVPKAMVVEWLAHGGLHGNPGLLFHGYDHLRILKGLVLTDTRPNPVRVLAGAGRKEGDLFRVPVEMHSLDEADRDVLHASAEIVLADFLPEAEAGDNRVQPGAYAHTRQEIYESLLFHGPEMQGIESVESCSEDGIVVRCKTAPAPASWIRNPIRNVWLADPLALDCGFQAVILWVHEKLGAFSLPSYSREYRQYRRAYPEREAEGPVTIVSRITRCADHSVTADLEFLDAGGELIARMRDFECTVTPSLNRAFRRNRLTEEFLAS